MLTFRIAITTAVMAFVTALTACLIFIQIATFHAAARAAASAAMDAASANTLSRLKADVSELNALVRVPSSNPSLANANERSEADDAVVLFKAALQELPQADSIYVGYDNGCWLQVRRLDVLDQRERERLSAIAADRNRPPKHVERARIVLASADRYSAQRVAQSIGVSRPTVWRWQQRYAESGVEGLLRDKTRKPGKAPIAAETTAQVVALTCTEPPHQAAHPRRCHESRRRSAYLSESGCSASSAGTRLRARGRGKTRHVT